MYERTLSRVFSYAQRKVPTIEVELLPFPLPSLDAPCSLGKGEILHKTCSIAGDRYVAPTMSLIQELQGASDLGNNVRLANRPGNNVRLANLQVTPNASRENHCSKTADRPQCLYENPFRAQV